jgi:TFIIF-interacting CTD phosphatase-like protein
VPLHPQDLSCLNRDLRRVIAIDDSAAALSLQPGNLIRVKPYTNGADRDDTTLEDLIPFLEGASAERRSLSRSRSAQPESCQRLREQRSRCRP